MKRVIVQKYGGSSVATTDKVKFVAQRVARRVKDGYRVVVVLSAMGDTTDDLIEMANQISSDPNSREMDMLLSTGEQVSIALFSMAIQELGISAISLTGGQVGIVADSVHRKAKNGEKFASAIMTTDTCMKTAAVELKLAGQTIRIGGACKGSGMIHPNLATMLAYFTTDAKISGPALKKIFQRCADRSFNRITVDGDSSTNDTALLFANGMSGGRSLIGKSLKTFEAALLEIMVRLAKMIVADGEGATKMIEITVKNARSEQDANKAAKAIANSPLVKTAMFGNDPNWGRILCAAGYSGAKFNQDNVNLDVCDIALVRKGQPVDFDAKKASRKLDSREVKVLVDLGAGKSQATVWTCDFSYDYVKINAEYHT